MANENQTKTADSDQTDMTMPRHVMVLASPKAGTGRGRDRIDRLIDLLRSRAVETTLTHDISRLRLFSAESMGQPPGSRLVVAAGGDGTLSLVAENVCAEMPLVPMPMGTENLLARHFGYTSDASQVIKTIRAGQSYWLDAGHANGKLFLVMASCGFDAEVVRGLHLRRKGHISRMSYAKPLVRALRRYRFPLLRVHTSSGPPESEQEKSHEHACRWAMVFNLPKYGGALAIEPNAIGNDGLLDVILFKKGSLWSGLRYVGGIKTGLHQRFQDVWRQRATRLTISSSHRVPYQLDGDYAGHLPLTIETLPGRVHLRLPVDSKPGVSDVMGGKKGVSG